MWKPVATSLACRVFEYVSVLGVSLGMRAPLRVSLFVGLVLSKGVTIETSAETDIGVAVRIVQLTMLRWAVEMSKGVADEDKLFGRKIRICRTKWRYYVASKA